MNTHNTINYLEYQASDMAATEAFFTQVFSWKFTPYGAEYNAFSSPTIEGGFYLGDKKSRVDSGAALTVFYSETLEQTQEQIIQAGGKIVMEIFPFPGGRRFHFTEPSGNEFAVWSDR